MWCKVGCEYSAIAGLAVAGLSIAGKGDCYPGYEGERWIEISRPRPMDLDNGNCRYSAIAGWAVAGLSVAGNDQCVQLLAWIPIDSVAPAWVSEDRPTSTWVNTTKQKDGGCY